MNEKFFDLKKEKQDRMINAALKAFADKGYKKANTDDMVKDAGISKGLLFHYFISKQGLYEFICDYSVKYMIMELTSAVDKNATDYFEIRGQVERGRCNTMRHFPYMQRFLKLAEIESHPEVRGTSEHLREGMADAYFGIYEKAIIRDIRDVSFEKITDIVEYTLDGLLADHLRKGAFDVEKYQKQALFYLKEIQKLCEYSTKE